jgi:hypothetical protein
MTAAYRAAGDSPRGQGAQSEQLTRACHDTVGK